MYLLYEQLWGDLVDECDPANIIGLYDSKEKAMRKAKELIEYDLGNNYVLDKERSNLEEDGYVRLFYNNQDNWNCFYEIIIKEMECDL